MDDCRVKALRFLKKNKFRKAVKHFKKAAKKAFKKDEIAEHVYRQMCVIRFKILLGKYEKSIKKLEKLKSKYPNVFEENRHAQGMWHFLKGSALFYLGKGGEIREEAKKATAILSEKDEFNELDIVDYCQALLLEGKAHWHYREILASFSRFVKAMRLVLESKNSGYGFLLGKACGLIGVVLLDMNQIALGKEYLLLGLSILDQQNDELSKEHLYVGIINSDLALAHLKSAKKGNFEENLIAIEQCIANANNIFTSIYAEKPHRYLATIEKHNARLLRVRHQDNWKNYAKEILNLLDKELEIREKSFLIPKHRTYARIHNVKSSIYTAIGEFDNGLIQAQKALIKVSDLDEDYLEHLGANPTEEQLAKHISPTEQLKALYNKGRIYLKKYEKSKQDITYLGSVIDTIHLGLSYIKKIIKQFNSDEARMILIEQTRPLHELVVELIYISFQLQEQGITLPKKLRYEDLYETVQHNKSFLLLDGINNDFSFPVDSKRLNITQSNKSLLGTLEELQQNLSRALPHNQADHHLSSVKIALLDIEEQIEELSHEQPAKSLGAESLAATQEGLDDDDAGILSYFMGRRKLVAILVTKKEKGFHVQELITTEPEIDVLKAQIKELHSIVKVEIDHYQRNAIGPHKESFNNPIKRFSELSYAIYQKVLEPINSINELNRLYIIPDKELWFTPFEALVTEEVADPLTLSYHELPYFIDKKILISYHFSTRAISYLYNKAGKNGDLITDINQMIFTAGEGRSPNEENDMDGSLNRWMKRIDSISSGGPMAVRFSLPQHKKNTALFATMQMFDAVVIAAHGSYEKNEYPKIRLTDNRSISIRDIKKAGRLNWELLVLYTCFSGEGELRNGEGLRTLCRAFFEQHVKNIVYSLYMVNSSKNKEVMELFFDYIVDANEKQEHCFAKALFNAKLKVAHAEKARPGDWSGLLFMGDQKRSLFN